MSKKDYELIARVLREARDGRGDEHDQVINSLAQRFASELARANPRFQGSTFRDAAGCPK